MRAVGDVLILVMVIVLATAAMRLLTWQPAQATASATSTPTPAANTNSLAAEQECLAAEDQAELDDCASRAVTYKATVVTPIPTTCLEGKASNPTGATCSATASRAAYSQEAMCTVDASPTFDPRDPCGAPP
jgi:hypothetical protein